MPCRNGSLLVLNNRVAGSTFGYYIVLLEFLVIMWFSSLLAVLHVGFAVDG